MPRASRPEMPPSKLPFPIGRTGTRAPERLPADRGRSNPVDRGFGGAWLGCSESGVEPSRVSRSGGSVGLCGRGCAQTRRGQGVTGSIDRGVGSLRRLDARGPYLSREPGQPGPAQAMRISRGGNPAQARPAGPDVESGPAGKAQCTGRNVASGPARKRRRMDSAHPSAKLAGHFPRTPADFPLASPTQVGNIEKLEKAALPGRVPHLHSPTRVLVRRVARGRAGSDIAGCAPPGRHSSRCCGSQPRARPLRGKPPRSPRVPQFQPEERD